MTETEDLAACLEALSGAGLLAVGDVMHDRFVYGDVERVSPEAPIPVLRVEREAAMLGGAGNVLRNAAALGARCDLVAVTGDDVDGRRVVELLKDLGTSPDGVVAVEGRATTRKSRVVARSQQVLRFDLIHRAIEIAAERVLQNLIVAALDALLIGGDPAGKSFGHPFDPPADAKVTCPHFPKALVHIPEKNII